jgi:hypothetical protein
MANDAMDGFFDPTGDSVVERKQLAPRVAELKGKTIGLLINTKPAAEPILREVQALLRDRIDGVQFREARTNSQRPAPPEAVETLRQCDAVINAIGD